MSDIAQDELKKISTDKFDWVSRTKYTLEILIPELPSLAKRISYNVPRKLNSAHYLANIVESGFKFKNDNNEFNNWYDSLKSEVSNTQSLIGHLESQQVSAEIQRQIITDEIFSKIVYENGNSIYPDLILYEHKYDDLDFQDRKKPIDGPSLQGKKKPRPSNVPDGCEIKTNRGTKIRVDAHGAHPGLHIGVTWDFEESEVVVNGVWIGYVRIVDHKESGRNVSVTTVKYSFGHSLFISLLE